MVDPPRRGMYWRSWQGASMLCATSGCTAPRLLLMYVPSVLCHTPQVPPELLQQHHTELLTKEEVEYVYSTSDAAVQKCRTVSRALLRSTLSKYLQGSHPQSLTFALNAHGKPSLTHPSNMGQQIQFNITHTESIVGEQHDALTPASMLALDPGIISSSATAQHSMRCALPAHQSTMSHPSHPCMQPDSPDSTLPPGVQYLLSHVVMCICLPHIKPCSQRLVLLAGCAVALHHPVGLDVEHTSRQPRDVLKLVKRRCAAELRVPVGRST